ELARVRVSPIRHSNVFFRIGGRNLVPHPQTKNMTQELEAIIERAWEARSSLNAASASNETRNAIEAALQGLDQGRLRVAEKINDQWQVHQWLKKAVLLSFRLHENRLMDSGAMRFYDKVASKFEHYDEADFAQAGIRVVPAATEIGRASCRESGGSAGVGRVRATYKC